MSEKIWSAVDAYFSSELIAPDAVLAAALRASETAGLPSIQVSAAQGKLLQLLAQTQRARRILEIGTLGGYSTLWLARGLSPDGCLVTLEIDPRHAAVARQNFVHAGLVKQIELTEGPALESLARLQTQDVAPFDLIFIDADKTNNLEYIQAALAMSRVSSLIVVDNVVRGGGVVAKGRDAAVEGVWRMTEWISQEPRLSATVIQTVGEKGYDGFLLARVQAL